MKPDKVTTRLGESFQELGVSVDVELPSGETVRLGGSKPMARIVVRNDRVLRRLLTLRESGLADSYVRGEMDINGSMLGIVKCCRLLKTSHGLSWLARFTVPALFGQLFTNRAAIRKHYDLDPDFYLTFLDAKWPAYSQGIYLRDDEKLSVATERKFEFATESCRVGPGSHILEVGPGWGAYIRYLLPTGASITALTNSLRLKQYLESAFSSPRLAIIGQDFLCYHPTQRFSAVTMMGVLEHLPQYDRVCRKIRNILEPGGHVYIDASAAKAKYAMPAFIYKHIFPYNHSFMHLEGFLRAARNAGLELVSIDDDSVSYQRTIATWANNLERNRGELERRYGIYNFRRFRLYLWGSANAFEEGSLQCHRLVLRAAL